MAQEMEKRINEVCVRILAASRSELYLHMRFLDVALSAFSYVQNPGRSGGQSSFQVPPYT